MKTLEEQRSERFDKLIINLSSADIRSIIELLELEREITKQNN